MERPEDLAGRTSSRSTRPSRTARTSTPRASARRRSARRTSSRRPSRRRPACSTCRRTTSAWTTSRSRSSTRRASPMSGATLSMYPAPNSHGGMGNFIAWDAGKGKIVWSKPEKFSVWSGALATAGDVVFYGTLEGYLKAVDVEDRQGAVQVQDAVRHHRQRVHLQAQGQAVRRRALGHRRLGRHRPGGGPHRTRPPASARSAATRLSTTTPRSAAS